MPSAVVVTENPGRSRFEIQLDGELAVAEYQIDGDCMIFTHTEVPPAFRGKGLAEQLALAGLRAARDRGLRIDPQCSYIARVMERHPELQAE